jgi:hypothetical protein
MRHFLQPQGSPPTVGGLAGRMQAPAPARPLVAPPRLPPAPTPRLQPALRTAVALPSVAPGAQVDRLRAQVAHEPPAVGTQSQTPGAWTPASKPAMIPSPGAPAPGPRGGRGSCHRRTPVLRTLVRLHSPPTPPPTAHALARAAMMLAVLKGFTRSTARIPRFPGAAHRGRGPRSRDREAPDRRRGDVDVREELHAEAAVRRWVSSVARRLA